MKALPRIFVLTVLCALVFCSSVFASGGETLYTSQYCFSSTDFTFDSPTPPDGILVTAVPDEDLARIRLGNRTICVGDVLDAAAMEQLRMEPLCQNSSDALLCYQPIHGSCLGAPTRLTIHIRSGKNEAPTAKDAEFETYKNIANDGKLIGSDPENAPLSFQVEQQPKRGSLSLEADGRFVYTPNKNKVGKDSFTFTVTDEAGNTSQPATVKINILKPTDANGYKDMENSSECFEAMWLEENGLDGGRSIGGMECFCPDDGISRGEFLLMVMKLGGIEPEDNTVSCFSDCQGSWMEGYLTTAMAKGIITGEAGEEGLVFRPNDCITGQEAAVMLRNMLQVPVAAAAMECDCQTWSCEAVTTLKEAGVSMKMEETPLRRIEAAKLLYEASKLR